MSTTFIDCCRCVLALPVAMTIALAGCASKPTATNQDNEPAIDTVSIVKPIREQTAETAATSSQTAHVTPVQGTPEGRAAAPLAASDYGNALALLNKGSTDEALELFQRISEEHPKLSGPLVNIGLIQLRQERWDDALKNFDLAVKINPSNPYAWNLRGIVLRELGRFNDARISYERALSLDQMYARVHFNLGVLADLYLQDLPLALKHYGLYQSLQNKPDRAVSNWIADLRNRAASATPEATSSGSQPTP